MTNDQFRELQAAVAHQKAGRLADAAKIYRRILQATPGNFDAVYLLATLHAQQGQFGPAIDLFRRAGKIRPDVLDIDYNLAVVLGIAGNHAEAASVYQRILKINPRHPSARNNYAASLLNSGRVADALQQYDELVALYPDLADAHSNRGMALQYLNRFDEALVSYDKALALRPGFAQAHANRGNVLTALGRPDDALDSYNKAISLQPDFADAYNNAGNIYSIRGSHSEALAAYDRAISLRPDDSEAKSTRLYAKMHLCDWSNFDAESQDVISCIRRQLPVYPFTVLAIATSPDDQLQCARSFARARVPVSGRPLWQGDIYRHDRIRVAYISADFRPHAVSNLMVGMFECHDRSQFDVTAISIGPEDNSEYGRRLNGAFEHFIDVQRKSDQEIAALMRELEIDIAVDLMGHTRNARLGIFARRPAPIQVSYLGYLATTGVEFIDYVIADKIVLPPDQQKYYTERIVRLPDCFMVNDNRQVIAPGTPSRQDAGLPDEGFVFCSFNASYKFGRPMFELWMRLLHAAAGSVLWLLESNSEMAINLRREARRCGIDPDRIVFAPRIEFPRHLARQRLAGLFLDSSPYNAGATAAAALWSGVPVLTVIGGTFVGRMAASMLHAIGMPELVTESPAAYEALALKIANEPAFCGALKDKLSRNRETFPLFDTQLFTRHIVSAYAAMYKIHQAGLAPDHIDIPNIAASKPAT